MNEIFETLAQLIGSNRWLAPVFALLSGLLTSMTPCSLSTVPLVIGCVSGGDAKGKKAVFISLMFVAGSAITFTGLGIAAALLGEILRGIGPWLHLILGLLLIAMALQMFGVFELLPELNFNASARRGLWGAFITGLLAGAFASHCTTPVLVTLLAIAAEGSGLIYGALLMVLFSLGHGVLPVIAGAFSGKVLSLMEDPRFHRAEKIIRTVLGIIILIAAAYLLYEAGAEGFMGHEHHDHLH